MFAYREVSNCRSEIVLPFRLRVATLFRGSTDLRSVAADLRPVHPWTRQCSSRSKHGNRPSARERMRS
jgi:hypothetical protein